MHHYDLHYVEVSCISKGITKENQKQFDKPDKFYTPWRIPFVKPSYFVARHLANWPMKHPQYLSYAMIIIGFIGSTVLISNDIFIRIGGWCLLIFSYFLDMLDGKVSRMTNKPFFGLICYLDNQYHLPITAYTLFIISLRVYLNTNNIIFILMSFFLPWIFIWKGSMQHSFEYHYLTVINKPDDMLKHQNQMSRDFYMKWMYDTTGIKRIAYICSKPFLDATDIWFALLPIMIFHLEPYYILVLLVLHTSLLFYKFHIHTKKLNPEYDTYIEVIKKNKRFSFNQYKKHSYDSKVMLDKKEVLKDIKTIYDILNKHNMKCFLYGGTLLGAYRNNDFIHNDTDVDLVYCGLASDFFNIEKELSDVGFLLDVEYNHIKIIAPNKRSKMCISIFFNNENHYSEHSLKTNRIGSITDGLSWMFSARHPKYKYDGITPEKLLHVFYNYSIIMPLKLRKVLWKTSRAIYHRIGYKTLRFDVDKDVVDPLKDFNFMGINVYMPNKPEKIIEYFYGKDWRIPSENYTSRTLTKIPNQVK